MKLPLSSFTVLDLSQRLPGPLAGKILHDLGARVIKIENVHYPDHFLMTPYEHIDESSFQWYQELNRNKEIVRIDMNDPKALDVYLDDCDGIILGLPSSLKKMLPLSPLDLEKRKRPMGVVEIFASFEQGLSLHDVNAMSLGGLLSLYIADKDDDILPPPFLPFAGIAFGQSIATTLLAATLLARAEGKTNFQSCSLLETVHKIYAPIWPPSLQKKSPPKFLHNGAFPCYSLYKTKDGHYVAVAAVEEKFWTAVQKIFGIPLVGQERFRKDLEAFTCVSRIFMEMTLEEIENKISGKDLCLTVVKRIC